jgi:hypothetical protein
MTVDKSMTTYEAEDATSGRTEPLVEGYVPDTEEEKKLVRKIDLILLPTIWLMYLLSYLDRTK